LADQHAAGHLVDGNRARPVDEDVAAARAALTAAQEALGALTNHLEEAPASLSDVAYTDALPAEAR
jgi:hypothetical protein